MDEETIVYKVVRRDHRGALISNVVGGDAEIRYEMNSITKPPAWLSRRGYGICCFRSLEDAKTFVLRGGSDDSDIICKAIAIGKITSYINLPAFCHINLLADGNLKECGGEWPEGTIMCEAIEIRDWA